MTLVGIHSEGLVVVGEATHSAVPDMVELTAGAQTPGTSATQALRENAARMLHIVQALTAMGISQTDIETTGLNVYPLYPPLHPQPGQLQPAGLSVYPQTWQSGAYGEMQPIVGYRASSSVKVSLRDANRGGEALDTAIAAGANFNIGVSFKIRDESTVRGVALQEAYKDAQAKADALAEAVGKKLGDPVGVTGEAFFPARDGGRDGGLMGDGQLALQGSLGAVHGAPISTSPVSPDELTFVARVQVTYKLL